ncbi:MAG: U32 family peptidase C-terminal domain-containing protein [Rhodocyclaceae bacterium]
MSELLSPAGTLTMLNAAINFGADAIYAGQPRYSLRVRNNEFNDLQKLKTAIDTTHLHNKKIYIVTNLLPHNAKLKTFPEDIQKIVDLQPDALIMSDVGLIDFVRNKYPEMPIHLSVQSNTTNYAAVKFWQKLGLQRIILSRELSLDEIAEIRQQCPDIELEVFIHGALCIAYSGRCLMSGYFNHRDANQGTCTNACRWEYKVAAEKNQPINFYVKEPNRPQDLMPIEEDEHGTYLFNSKDLRGLEHVETLLKIGVDSFKIEGRTKSAYYVARTTQVYRQAIDDFKNGRTFDYKNLSVLENLANRGYTDGFFQRHHDADYQNYLQGHSTAQKSQYVADVGDFDNQNKRLHLIAKNHFEVGDTLEFITPEGNFEMQLTENSMFNKKGENVSQAKGIGHQVWINFDTEKFALPIKDAFVAKIFKK